MENDDAQDTAYQRRVNAEVEIFARQDRIHQHASMFGWRNETILGPEFLAAFGHKSTFDIYATTIAAAIERTGSGRVLSLGCGNGEQEVEVLRAADRLHLPEFCIRAVELSPITAARARTAAAEAGFFDRFIVVEGDLNKGLPDTEPVAAIMAHHTLHHIVALEQVFDQAAAQLLPEGAFVTFDMIGRNGHMLWEEVRPLVRSLWSMLPMQQRFDHSFQRPMPHYQDWDCAVASFEGVRSQDILGLIATRFEPESLVVWGGISQAFLGVRACANFSVDNEADRAFIEAVQHLESRLLEQRRTTPVEMCGIFRSRLSRFSRRRETLERIARSVRNPAERFDPIESVGFPNPYPQVRIPALPMLELGVANPVSPGTPAAAALLDGWEAPEHDGVFAILDEQSLSFRLDRAASHVNLHVWSFLSAAHALTLHVSQRDRKTGIGPLTEGESAVLQIPAPGGAPRRDWDIRISCSNYRRQYLDGGVDARPLAYRLASIEPVFLQ